MPTLLELFTPGKKDIKDGIREEISKSIDENTPEKKKRLKLPSDIKKEIEEKSIRKTISIARGLWEIAGHSSSRKENKETIERKLKKELLNPETLGKFLMNLGQYLESI